MSMVKIRKHVEREIAAAFIENALAAGYSISIDDGEDCPLARSTDKNVILAAMFTVDDEYLFLHHPDESKNIERVYVPPSFGWVRFIYGNDGWDVISDYTTNLETLMGGKVEETIRKYDPCP